MQRWNLVVMPGLILAQACIIGVRGSGVSRTEVVELDPFDEIRLTNLVDVEVRLGDELTAEVSCDDNLLQYLQFEVQGDELVVRTEPGVNLLPQTSCLMELQVTDLTSITATGSGSLDVLDPAPDLFAIRSTGSGNITVVTAGAREVSLEVTGSGDLDAGEVAAELLEARLTGSGDVTVAGVADRLDLSVTGSGDFEGADLEVIDAEVRLTGSGDARFDATGEVMGALTASGDLILGGDARTDVRTTGSGDVVRR